MSLVALVARLSPRQWLKPCTLAMPLPIAVRKLLFSAPTRCCYLLPTQLIVTIKDLLCTLRASKTLYVFCRCSNSCAVYSTYLFFPCILKFLKPFQVKRSTMNLAVGRQLQTFVHTNSSTISKRLLYLEIFPNGK